MSLIFDISSFPFYLDIYLVKKEHFFGGKTVYDIGNDSNPFKHFKTGENFLIFLIFPLDKFLMYFLEEFSKIYMKVTDFPLKVIDEITIEI